MRRRMILALAAVATSAVMLPALALSAGGPVTQTPGAAQATTAGTGWSLPVGHPRLAGTGWSAPVRHPAAHLAGTGWSLPVPPKHA